MFHLYGLILGLGVVAGFSAAEKIADVKQRELLRRVALWAGLGALVGARLYHLITDWRLYANASFIDVIAVWRGGMGIYGAVVGAVVGCVAYLWRYKQLTKRNILVLLDLLAFGLPLGQAVGRWGNYVNHELFGVPTTLPWGIFIPQAFRPQAFAASTQFHPLFFYESIAMLMLWLFFWRKRFVVGTGNMFCVYLVFYGVVRFMLDFIRIEPARWMGLPVSQVVSVAVITLGLVCLLARHKKSGTL